MEDLSVPGERIESSVGFKSLVENEAVRMLEPRGKRQKEQQARAGAGSNQGLPRKRFYRARAHSNPLSDSHFPVPIKPADCDWAAHFPDYFKSWSSLDECGSRNAQLLVDTDARGLPDSTLAERPDTKVRFADVGCGFGGLLVQLSPLFPDKLMVGMELRDKADAVTRQYPSLVVLYTVKQLEGLHYSVSELICAVDVEYNVQVSEYVKERIIALRRKSPCQYKNISVLRTNAMKYLPNYFEKGQLEKMFFLFPDPHFKEKNHRRRIISQTLLAEYAYVMAVGGILYTITDVEELGEWMKSNLDAHPLFEGVAEDDLRKDQIVTILSTATEEGQKVERNKGLTFRSVYRRVGVRN